MLRCLCLYQTRPVWVFSADVLPAVVPLRQSQALERLIIAGRGMLEGAGWEPAIVRKGATRTHAEWNLVEKGVKQITVPFLGPIF